MEWLDPELWKIFSGLVFSVGGYFIRSLLDRVKKLEDSVVEFSIRLNRQEDGRKADLNLLLSEIRGMKNELLLELEKSKGARVSSQLNNKRNG